MKMTNNPIVTSLLDNDAYKFHMQQAIFHRYRDVKVVAKFHCRGNDSLGIYSNEISKQVEMMQDLKLKENEYLYLSNFPYFQKNYLDWIKSFRFRSVQVKIKNYYGKLDIQIDGLWCEVILWEVPLLATISEIVYRNRFPKVSSRQAIKKLRKKIVYFYRISKDLDLSNFQLIDFGTRRRFSQKVQFDIIKELKKSFPYFIGTSNYQIANQYDLRPMGTQSHEWFQAHQQISKNLKDSQKDALQAWLEEYSEKLSNIALTDCINMDAFLKDFFLEFAIRYHGLRHDSGNPISWGEKAIAHYKMLNINPTTKILVFSDNLNFKKSLRIYRHFKKRINLIFGIGTYLTCDLPNIKPLNIVIKLIKCNGRPVAKLSDSPGKTIFQDRSFIKKLKKAFNLLEN